MHLEIPINTANSCDTHCSKLPTKHNGNVSDNVS